MNRTSWRRAAALACLSLSLGGCANWPGGVVIDAPREPGQPAAAPAAVPAGPALTEPPAPGLSAPVDSAAPAPAAASATAQASTPAPTPAATPSAPAASGASAAGDEESGEHVAGRPRDPIKPDRYVNFDDSALQIDLWTRLRAGFSMPDLDGELVRDREQYYATRPDYMARMVERGSRYLFHVLEELDERDMPRELALLPFIESAFNPQAMSSARASGMWQFIPSTGRLYDLRQNVFRDDRRDVLASTRAALDYLQRLHGMFGDWHLALAAYNWGEGSVRRAITRNERAGLPTDYASLRMPTETRYYVPKFQAIKNIIARPEAYGITLPAVKNHPYFVAVPIERDIDVALAQRLAGLSAEEFRQLNPSLNKPVILAAGTPQVLLPYDNANRFVRALQTHRGPLASWTAWVVPKTMRTGAAAQQAGMSESQLREVNRIPPRMLIKAGSTLLVPRPERKMQDVSEHVADNATMQLAPDLPPMRRVVVKARRGETTHTLARRYRVSAQQVAGWNKVRPGARFATGQRVTVFVPTSSGRAVAGRKAGKGRAAVAGKAGKRSAKAAGGKPRKAMAGKGARRGKAAAAGATKKGRSSTAVGRPGRSATAKGRALRAAASERAQDLN
jgi:membrane-bound lytic murein transglycosylase D